MKELDFIIICDDKIVKYYEKIYKYDRISKNNLLKLINKIKNNEKYEKYEIETDKKITLGLITQSGHISFWYDYSLTLRDNPLIWEKNGKEIISTFTCYIKRIYDDNQINKYKKYVEEFNNMSEYILK